jgi:hypothetical protein
MKTMKILNAAVFVTVLCLAPDAVRAAQPLDAITRTPMKYYVQQGPAQCGPAAFYIVFKYYGDHLKPDPFYYDSKGRPLALGRCNRRNTAEGAIDTVTEDCGVSALVKGGRASTPWSSLVAAARDIHYRDEDGSLAPYYGAFGSHDAVTPPGNKGARARMEYLMDRIVPMFLDRDGPVIVHLARRWPFPGHYIVLVGYDPARQAVYYMDPNSGADRIVQSVSRDAFVKEYWYGGSAPALWGKARWSGKWLGFRRPGNETVRP